MSVSFNTMDDFEFDDKVVLIRVDINVPVDPNSGFILDDSRIRIHSDTIKELHEKGAKVVILAHQSRAGKNDFTTLEQHSKYLSNILGLNVKYIDDIFGSNAKKSILNLKRGEILLLENVRFYSEETLNKDPKDNANTHLVKKLSPLIDIYINDAFATAHRSQASLTGFPYILPSAAGRVMEKELKILYDAYYNVKKPCTFVLGGVKADDSIMVMENVLKNKTADYVLTSGLIANIFLCAKNVDIGESNKNFILSRGYENLINKSENLLKEFPDNIIIPTDVAVLNNEKRLDVPVNKIEDRPIWDIGVETIKNYAKIIRKSKTIFANGPAGVFENPEFSMGTEDLLNAIAGSEGFSIIGGGHVAAAAVSLGYADKMDHISTGGGASINLLAGQTLPAVKVLEKK